MTRIVAEHRHALVPAGSDAPSAQAVILGVGTAVPMLRWTKEQTADGLAALWNLSAAALDRWRRIVTGSEIETRHGVLAPAIVAPMTTAQRMTEFERHAPPLACEASLRAIKNAGIAVEDVTDIVVVSCTGFWAPGLDVELIARLGLSPRTRRTTIGFMGCFGAINGLRVAAGLCAADPAAVTLLVCCELCSLHIRTDDSAQNQVASALFADGAAAAVLAGPRFSAVTRSRDPAAGERTPIGRIGATASLLLYEGREWMSWRITDAGFAMTLTREVPVALRRGVRAFVDDLGAGGETTFIVHPGGPGVLDAVESALNLANRGGSVGGERGLQCARQVLRDFGNMSSATALFVLEEALRRGGTPPMTLLAFGPGLTIEGLNIDARECDAEGEGTLTAACQ